jgi:Uma2 family endonuclease
MSAAVLPPAAESDVRRVRFSRGDVERMLEAGILEGRRFELIEGELIDKMGQKPPHIYVIRVIQTWLASIFGIRLQVQSALEAAQGDREFSLPEPDLCVLAEAKPEYRKRLVRGDETLLVVEVADTSLRQDTTVKKGLYARAGVPEYWVVSIPNREVIVHRDLRHGTYRQVTRLSERDTVSVASVPEKSLPVALIFGEEQ